MKRFFEWLQELGSVGAFLAALLDGAGLPLPGGVDVLVVYLASRVGANIPMLGACTVLGSTLGNLLLFAIARRGGKAYLDKRAQKPGAHRFRHWFERYGLSTVFVSALVPLPVMPMKIFVLCAGALGTPPHRFILAFLAARIPRYFGLALLGQAMGANTMGWLEQHVWYLVAFAAALLLMLAILVRFADRNSKAEPTADQA